MNFFQRVFSRDESLPETPIHEFAARPGRTPFYFKATMVLVGLFIFFYSLKILQDVLIPVSFALLIAILLNPLVNRLMNWRINKVVAIIVSLLLAVLVIAGIIYFISTQVAHFSELAPQLKQRGSEILHTIQNWLNTKFNFSIQKQDAILNDTAKNSQTYIGKTLGGLLGVVGMIVLLPIYTFLILYYKPLFLNFFYDIFDDRHEEKVSDILNETKGAIQGYIVGLLIETAIVAALNSIALLILGVKYAILLGLIGGLLNMIPYIGGIVAIAMPVIMSLLSGDGGFTTPLLVVASYSAIQFVDNNLIQPRIVSSKVDVNAFVTIFIVLLGGSIWGIAGMFLSIPFVAICKIIFDRVPTLKPWGRVLGVKIGDPQPPAKVVSELELEEYKESTGQLKEENQDKPTSSGNNIKI